MEVTNIPTLAGTVWRVLTTERRRMTLNELQLKTGLHATEVSMAIGWLAHERQIICTMENDVEYYIGNSLLSRIRQQPARITDKDISDEKAASAPVMGRSEETYLRFMRLLLTHYKEHHDVAFYAGQLFLTSKYLSVVIKKACGKTPHELIEETLIEEMLFRLKHTEDSVKEISYQLNFSNLSFFGKFFKRHTGMSPLAYRKNLPAKQ